MLISPLIITITILTTANCASYQRGTSHLEIKLDELRNDVLFVQNHCFDNEMKFNKILDELVMSKTNFEKIQNGLNELQRRSEIWSTHEHFITSWLDQISAVDRKLDIIIKSQERLNKVETNLNILQEKFEKIDLDKLNNLINTSAGGKPKVNSDDVPASPTKASSNELFSFINEYTTRGVLSTLNRIESQLTLGFEQKFVSCNQLNTTVETLEDIAAKVDVIADKLVVPNLQPNCNVTPESPKNPDDNEIISTKQKKTCRLIDSYEERITILERQYQPNDMIYVEYLNKSFSEYEEGFETETAIWYGLADLRELSRICNLKLRVELWDFDENFAWAEYEKFQIADNDEYTLNVDGYSGNATDSLSSHNGMGFSTFDRNNDKAPECCPCAITYGSGWWFNKCFESNLNGKYAAVPYGIAYYDGIIWEGWLGNYSLKRAKMIAIVS